MFVVSSIQQDMAYSLNFYISIVNSIMNLGIALGGVAVIFGRVAQIAGWDKRSVLALTGVYMLVNSLRSLFLAPSLEALAGMEGEIWSGRFDFTLLKPIDTQFLVSFRHWHIMSILDLLLGLVIVAYAASLPGTALTGQCLLAFCLALCAGVILIYAAMLAISALVFWSPGLLFTWVLDSILQMARMPVDIYPGWLRFILIWILPVGIIITVPAKALTTGVDWMSLMAAVSIALGMLVFASILFRGAIKHYKSASS